MNKKLGQRVLERAVELFGEAQLAKLLEISERALRHYLNGEQHIPEPLLLRAVDLVMDNGGDGPPPR